MLKYYVKENSLYEDFRYNDKDMAFYFENIYYNQINLINYAKLS